MCGKYNPKSHDNRNISRCQAKAKKLKKKLEAMKIKYSALFDSLFSKRTGKLQTAFTCRHKHSSDTKIKVSFTGVLRRNDVARLG